LLADDFKLVVFSNQAGVGRHRDPMSLQYNIDMTIDRFDAFQKFVNAPVEMYLAIARGDVPDKYRKPHTGMWTLMENMHMERENAKKQADSSYLVKEIDKGRSFYVGNSAGRASDRTAFDIQFAEAIGVDFKTDEWLHFR